MNPICFMCVMLQDKKKESPYHCLKEGKEEKYVAMQLYLSNTKQQTDKI